MCAGALLFHCSHSQFFAFWSAFRELFLSRSRSPSRIRRSLAFYSSVVIKWEMKKKEFLLYFSLFNIYFRYYYYYDFFSLTRSTILYYSSFFISLHTFLAVQRTHIYVLFRFATNSFFSSLVFLCSVGLFLSMSVPEFQRLLMLIYIFVCEQFPYIFFISVRTFANLFFWPLYVYVPGTFSVLRSATKRNQWKWKTTGKKWEEKKASATYKHIRMGCSCSVVVWNYGLFFSLCVRLLVNLYCSRSYHLRTLELFSF